MSYVLFQSNSHLVICLPTDFERIEFLLTSSGYEVEILGRFDEHINAIEAAEESPYIVHGITIVDIRENLFYKFTATPN